jgi:hypothetical protein
MTEENTPAEGVAEQVDDATEEVPEHVVTNPPSTHENHDDKVIGAIEEMGNKIIDALNTAKEASPVTETQEEVLDETPLRKPWTHRTPFRKR